MLRLRDVFEDDTTIYLVMDFVKGGELFEKIIDRGNYSEEDTRKIIKQVLEAVKYLHTQGIAHRDLKVNPPGGVTQLPQPENLLCGDDELHILVADFGLSRMFGENEAMETQCGSLEYTGAMITHIHLIHHVIAAPEVLAGQGYTKACDLWSIGVITFVL